MPLLFEHDGARRVGRCHASWEGKNGELRVAGVIQDEKLESDVRRGVNTGLSLGTDVVHDTRGKALYKAQQELSVCAQPRRPGCFIDTVDGKSVRTKRLFSEGSSLSGELLSRPS